MNNRMQRAKGLAAATALLATLLAVVPAQPALAAGTPNISLAKEMPARSLAGDPAIEVTLTASNSDTVNGYNLSFKDVLPPGTSFVAGSPAPTTTLVDQPATGFTTILWENVSDLPPNNEQSVSYTFTHDATYDVGDSITNDASAYVHQNPRFIPAFSATGAPSNFTGNDSDSQTTLLVPFLLGKAEPQTEEELLRGLHDHQTAYTLTISNNFLNSSTNFEIQDWIPAGMEFLACGTVDNSGGAEEYPGSGAINPGNAPPLGNPCLQPSTVDTVSLDPDGPGQAMSQVYTHVTWSTADLGLTLSPGQVWRIDYVAAIPDNANALFAGTPPTPASLLQAANVTNNTGASTQETTSEIQMLNYALATGDYTGDGVEYSDGAYESVESEDISIHKSVDNEVIGQGNINVWTLEIESSEYVGTADEIVVTDTSPDGLCPLGPGTNEGTSECDFGGEPAPSHPYTSATENSDGTWTLEWDFDTVGGLGPMGRTDDRTITFSTLVREFYQENGSDATPVVAEDSWLNTVALTAMVDGRQVFDDSEAGQEAPSLTILKEVADDPASEPIPFTCGDGSALTWDPLLGSNYAPGDHACWRLSVIFPSNLDTADATITDFIPVGHAYIEPGHPTLPPNSWAFGSGTTAGITATEDFTDADAGVLRWNVGDGGGFTEIGQVIQIVFSTTLVSPNDGFPGDRKENLMKFTHANSAGSTFPLRDSADAEWAEPIVDLIKGVYEVVRAGSAVEGPNDGNPNVDGVMVIDSDVVTYRLTINNSGTRAANDIEVIDVLPTELSCADVVIPSITPPGTCVAGQIEWLGATGISIAAGGSTFVEYDVIVPLGVAPGQTLTNTAGVRSYQSPTNQNTDFLYIPDDNIDPNVGGVLGDPNTSAADDTSSIVTTSITFTKTRTTQLSEPGNDGTAEATIGEDITYTITAAIPEGVTVYGPAVVSDALSSELELISAQILTWTGVPADEPVLVVDTGADLVTATFADPHANPVGGPAPGDDTLVIEVVARVADVASNEAGEAVRNDAAIDYETRLGAPLSETAFVDTDLVEPDIGVTKDEDDADDIVRPNDTFTYTITVDNAAGESVAHDVVVSDVVPEGLTPAVINDGGLWAPDGIPGNGVAGVITWTIASIDPGVSIDVTYSATVDDPVVGSSDLTNTVTATATSVPGAVIEERSAASPNAGTPPSRYEESASDTVVGPSMEIAKSVTGSPATIGDDLQYTLDVTIPVGTILYDTTVIDTVPAGIVFVGTASVTCTPAAGASCSPDIAPVQIGTEAAWYLGDLIPSSSVERVVTIVYDAYVADTTDNGDTETNSATVYGNIVDRITTEPPATTPDSSSFDVSAGPATADVDVVEPTLTVDKDVVGQNADDDLRRALPNETLTYQLTIENTGTAPAYDAVISDVVDSRVIANSIIDGTDAGVAWTVTDADPSDGTLGWVVPGPIPVGATFTITYDIDVWDATSADEVVVGPEFSNVGDIAGYWGVPEAERLANGYTYREYTDVASDQVDIELDLASIGDRVWFDRNADGVQDADEPGFENVGITVTYYGPDNALGGGDDEIFNTTTGPDGIWLVEDLPGGEYQVDVTTGDLPTGTTATWDLDDLLASPDGRWIGALAENEDKRDVDFGYNGSGLIGDEIWFDRNGDGVFDADELGIEGVEVTITWAGPDGPVSFTTTTNAAGSYEVDGLPPGDYTVTVNPATLPAGTDPTYDDDGIATPNTAALALGDGVAYRDADFGYNGSSSIGDNIWLDIDGNGAVDLGEPGIPDVVVQLTWPGEDGVLGGGDDEVFITTTDANGDYLFDGLLPGEYQVDVLGGLPAFVTNTFDEDLNGDSSVVVNLGAADDHLTADFGYQGNTSVGDLVYFDVNNNGALDAGEPGIPGVEVTLTYAGPDGTIGTADDIVLTMTTNPDGAYLFTGLPDGDFEVAVTGGVPPGMNNSADEDGDLDGNSGEFNVPDMTLHLTADFGYTGTGEIGDTIWFDRNGDGFIDADEPGLEGVTVQITWGGADGMLGTPDDVVLTTTTDANGTYSFPNLPPGDYDVEVVAATLPNGMAPITDPDGTLDNMHSLTLGDGEVVDTIDFGYRGDSSIGDTIWFDRNGDGVFDGDELGLGGVTVDLLWAGPDGMFGTPDDETFSTTTGPNGDYLFDNLPEGEYEVTVAVGTLPPGMTQTYDEDLTLDDTVQVTLATGDVHDTADFGYNGSGSIGDTVWIDRNGDGVQDPDEPGTPGQDVVLTWAGEDGVLGTPDDDTYTTITGPDGSYIFDGLPPGEYTVEVIGGIVGAATNTFDEDGDNDSFAPVTLGDGEVRDTVDFGYQGTAALGDTIWLDLNADGIQDAGEPGIPGVAVAITWYGSDGAPGGGDDVVYPAVTTDANGFYQVDGLPTGDYGVEVVAEVPAGLANTSDEDGDLDEQTDVAGLLDGEIYDTADFGYAGSGTIGDTVWLDQDGDGVQDPDEPGIPEVGVTLTWAGADGVLGTPDDVVLTTTTGPDGSYLFENLPAGDFTVVVDSGDLPSGVTPTGDPDGGADNSAAVTLGDSESNDVQDFGYQGGSSIGDTVFQDLNGNGVQDPGEPGVEGVEVTVTSHGPDGVLGTPDDIIFVGTTDPNGNYGETGIPGGNYTVVIDPGTLPPGTVPGDDSDGGDPTTTTTNIGDTEDVDTVDFPILGQSTLQGIVETHECTVDGFPLVGVAGVTIRITWDGPAGPTSIDVVTSADGTWVAPDLPPGDYTVELVLSTLPVGFVPTTPEIATATLGAGTAEIIDWVVDEPIDIVSRVWEDTNGNGANDAGEPGVAGVSVTLRDESGVAIATAVTDANGNYSFTGVVPGNYTVEIDPATVPPNLVLTEDPDGGADLVAVAVLSPCDAESTIDFGFRDRDDLPVTGFEMATALRLGVLLLLLGLGILLPASRREDEAA